MHRPGAARPQRVERDLQIRVIAALQLARQDRKLVQAVGAEMLAQATRHLRLLDRSKLKRNPAETRAARSRTHQAKAGPTPVPSPPDRTATSTEWCSIRATG